MDVNEVVKTTYTLTLDDEDMASLKLIVKLAREQLAIMSTASLDHNDDYLMRTIEGIK